MSNTRRQLRRATVLCGVFALLVALGPPSGCVLDRQGNDPSGSAVGGSSSGVAQGGAAPGSGGQAGSAQSSGGQGPTSSSGTGGCMPMPEDCLNGIDDDCDSLIDCDDGDDCDDHECVELPAGATAVQPVANMGQCSGELITMSLIDCSGCGCTVDDEGTCTHLAELYATHDCQGLPLQSLTIMQGSQGSCTPANTTADASETVGAKAIPVGLDDGSCLPDEQTVPSTERYLCRPTQTGSCSGGQQCVPQATSDCLLLQNNDVCPAGYSVKEVLYNTTRANCDCACAVTEQTCETSEHFHADVSTTCNGGGGKTDIDGNSACMDTGKTAIMSLQNHNDPVVTDATCESFGASSMDAVARALCCKM